MGEKPTNRGNWRVYHHESIDSTNLEALRLARREALPWTAVLADTQTEGRGRMGRTWLDLPGRCLLLTALVFPPPGMEGLLGPAMALSVAEVLQVMGTSEPAVKWPNDVLLRGRKVAGILTEGPAAGLFAIGTGLNVNAASASLPPEIARRSIFISEELDRDVELLPLADELLGRFERHHFRLMSGNGAEVVGRLREYDCLSGHEIRARSGRDLIEGRAVGWTDDGGLAIIGGDGKQIVLDAGEVTLS